MQRSRKTSQGRLKNTGHVDVTEFDYIKHLLSKSKASQASVARMVRRSESLISYIAHSKSYADYCEQREKIAGNPKEVKRVLKTESGKSVTANTSQVKLFSTPVQTSQIKLVEKPETVKPKADYSGALLGQTTRLTSAIQELTMVMVTIRPILAKAVDERDFERPSEDTGPKWYHTVLMIMAMLIVAIGYLFLVMAK